MNDYQLVRIGLLAAISNRAAALGQEIFDEAMDENERLREQVAGLEKMLREVQEFVSLVEYSDAFDNIYWAMHEDMKTAIDAALAASPAPTPAEDSARTTAPATEERQ